MTSLLAKHRGRHFRSSSLRVEGIVVRRLNLSHNEGASQVLWIIILLRTSTSGDHGIGTLMLPFALYEQFDRVLLDVGEVLIADCVSLAIELLREVLYVLWRDLAVLDEVELQIGCNILQLPLDFRSDGGSRPLSRLSSLIGHETLDRWNDILSQLLTW